MRTIPRRLRIQCRMTGEFVNDLKPARPDPVRSQDMCWSSESRITLCNPACHVICAKGVFDARAVGALPAIRVLYRFQGQHTLSLVGSGLWCMWHRILYHGPRHDL